MMRGIIAGLHNMTFRKLPSLQIFRTVKTKIPLVRTTVKKKSKVDYTIKLDSKPAIAEHLENLTIQKFASTEGKTNFSIGIFAAGMVMIFAKVSGKHVFLSSFVVAHQEHQDDPRKLDMNEQFAKFEALNRPGLGGRGSFGPIVDDIKSPLGWPDIMFERLRFFLRDTVSSSGYRLFVLTGLFLGHVGLPYYVSFDSADDVDLSKIRHKISYNPFTDGVKFSLADIERTDKNAHSYDELVQTFVLSDDAKRFFIASQILEFASSTVFFLVNCTSLFAFTALYVISATLNEALVMFSRPLVVRLAMYGMLVPPIVAILTLANYTIRALVDEAIDYKTCTFGKEYAAGGVEFYEKAIRRYELIVELLPDTKDYFEISEGTSYTLTELGNPDGTSNLVTRKHVCQELSNCYAQETNIDERAPSTFVAKLLKKSWTVRDNWNDFMIRRSVEKMKN